MDDHELLNSYRTTRSQDAFRQLVERHLVMVHATAWRLTGDAHLAEEIAQNAFVTLAQKAASIRPPQVVGGWLYNTTRNLAMHTIRSEQRRRQREQSALALQTLTPESSSAPILEELEPAMGDLADLERDALVLRYLENRPLREVGLELGVSEDAARMRVNRALDELREIFRRRGIVTSSVALAAVLRTASATALPSGLAATIAAAVTASTAATATTIVTTMSWINTKAIAAIVGGSLLTGVGTYYVQQHRIVQLEAAYQQQLADRDKTSAKLASVQAAGKLKDQELQQLRKNSLELAKLRNEVGTLRQQQQLQKAQPSSSPQATVHPPGAYITKDQLAFVGFDTPEAAAQSCVYVILTGDVDAIKKTLGPGPETEKLPESRLASAAASFKGMQIFAKKTLSEDRVELKAKFDFEPPDGPPWPVIIQAVERVNGSWRLSRDPVKEYTPAWDATGAIQSYEQ